MEKSARAIAFEILKKAIVPIIEDAIDEKVSFEREKSKKIALERGISPRKHLIYKLNYVIMKSAKKACARHAPAGTRCAQRIRKFLKEKRKE